MERISAIGKLSPSEVTYQRYYQIAFSSVWRTAKFKGMSGGRPFKEIMSRSKNALRSRLFRQSSTDIFHTARYCYQKGEGKVFFAIDAADTSEIERPDLLHNVQVYFKSNYWPGKSYPVNVVPIVNGNGALNEKRIRHLYSLKNKEKAHDLVFVSRVWGGIEHNVRCFEALARVPGNNYLLAIFTPKSSTASSHYEKEKAAARKRLERIGIRCSSKPMALFDLWEKCSKAKVVFIRAGKHLCIPWRMLDLLAMGSVVVTDSIPYPIWPEPLVVDTHYCSVNIPRPADTNPGPWESYNKANDIITSLINNSAQRGFISQAAGAYFIEHACPSAVGAYIRKTIESTL